MDSRAHSAESRLQPAGKSQHGGQRTAVAGRASRIWHACSWSAGCNRLSRE